MVIEFVYMLLVLLLLLLLITYYYIIIIIRKGMDLRLLILITYYYVIILYQKGYGSKTLELLIEQLEGQLNLEEEQEVEDANVVVNVDVSGKSHRTTNVERLLSSNSFDL